MKTNINSFGETCFIAATPLQILVALSIIRQIKCKNTIKIIVVGYFNDAENIGLRLNSAFKNKIIFLYFGDYGAAVRFVSNGDYDNLFIHWDVGFRTNLYLSSIVRKSKRIKISVYEEGVGTYRSNIYTGLREKIIKLMGLPTKLGGHRFTEKIYVFDVAEYIKNNGATNSVVKIKHSIDEIIDTYIEEITLAFDPDNFLKIENNKLNSCILYLSKWTPDYKVIKDIEGNQNSLVVIKFHPYIQLEINKISPEFLICPYSLPAELLIKKLSCIFGAITVLHHGSSTERYVSRENVKFIKQ